MRTTKKSIFETVIFISIVLVWMGALPAHAQQPATSSAPTEPAPDAAKQAFEALPEADRKAMQDGLIWTGDYKGIADGRFGRGTREAIIAFAVRSKLPGDGTLAEKGRAALAAAAQRAKAAVRFSLVSDEHNAIGIGVPSKLLPKVTATKSGTRYASTDNSAFLETSLAPESEASLEQRFDALRNETAQRKITYKASRPDFVVVAGEAAGTIFYTRLSRSERNGEKMLAGYTLTYPAAAKATYDIMAIAIANSFEPLAVKAPAVPSASAAAVSASVAAVPPGAAAVVAERAPAEAAPTKAFLAANGLVIAPGLVLTSLPVNNCRDAQIGARGVKIALQEKASGITLLEAANVTGPAIVSRSGPLKADMPVAVLAYAPKASSAGRDDRAEDLVAAPGLLRSSSVGPESMHVLASAQGVRAGSVVFDRSGALVGLLPAAASPEKRVGDVLPGASRPMVDAAAVAAFLGSKRLKETDKPIDTAPQHSLGEIVAESRAAVVPVYCVP
jgi:peptidoglycan hydrolase-like protein with peptidoglycan-binding domain